MSQTTRTWQVQPSWLPRLLGARAVTFRREGVRLWVTMGGGAESEVLASSLGNRHVFHRGLLWSRLLLMTEQGSLVLRGLGRRDGAALFLRLKQCWLAALAPTVAQAVADIEKTLNGVYPRESRINTARQLAKKSQAQFGEVPAREGGGEIDPAPFAYVADVAAWQEADIAGLRERYVARRLQEYKGFFDTIESRPLTARQREACVVDEDNNLVLAGAGTGKTSVMISRAGFLIESGQARADNILMLAFARKAAEEMQARIESRLGDCGIKVSTFHKLGKDIIAAVEGKQPALSPLAEDGQALGKQVDAWFEQHLKEPDYRRLALKYFARYLYPDTNEFDFRSLGEYLDFIVENNIRTLKGEQVKSLGECLLANYLFSKGIAYQYEPDYEHKTATPLYRQYRPDFYLPDLGIYIEYYGIDRDGNTAPYVDQKTYRAGMVWKRMTHARYGTDLVELFHYQRMEGSLFSVLDEQLAERGVVYQPLAPGELLDTLRDFGAISVLSSLLVSLLRRYRANCFEPGQLEARMEQAKSVPQMRAAVSLLSPILADYQSLLDAQGHIDFDDMIGKAITYVREGRFVSPWHYIMVDEFQDISDARARLIRYLKEGAAECSLFGVGDDWQAIYRFAGSDLRFTTDFESHFGATRVTALDLTFRFNSGISDVASRFVLQNPGQVAKQLKTGVLANMPTVSLLRADNRPIRRPMSGDTTPGRLERVLFRIAQQAMPDSRVYLLGRYGFNLPDRAHMRSLAQRFPSLSLEALTIHASKGRETDYVVILDLENGQHGFPSKKVTHPLLDALLPAQEAFAHAEERRLFYVALTRAKIRAYLIADMAVASAFVLELIEKAYPIEVDEFDASLAQKLFQLIKCGRCKTGALVPRESRFGRFYGCNKYPLCDHKERGCERCGGHMHRQGRFKVCLNEVCGNWVPVCPVCGAEMVRRKARGGSFWGCRSYRRAGEGCSHTESDIQYVSPARGGVEKVS